MTESNTLLEPLSDATKKAFEPAQIYDTDQLHLSMDDRGKKFIAKLVCVDPETKEPRNWPGVSRRAEEVIQERIPESKWLGNLGDPAKRNWWTLGATDQTVMVLHHAWPEHQLVFDDEDAEELFKFLMLRWKSQSNRATIAAEYKFSKIVPPMPADWIDHPDLPLMDHQKVAVAMSLGQEACGLFMDRGTGKTPTTIRRITMEAQRKQARTGEMLRVLVCCPPQVRTNWSREVERFTTVRGKTVIIKGSQRVRIKRLVETITTDPGCLFSVGIIGYDSIVPSIDSLLKVPWDLIICDESHFFKSPRTKRWAKGLEKLRHNAKMRMILTGSPIGNSPMDLWSQLEFLGEGLSGFQSNAAFKRFHGVWEDIDNTPGVKRLLGLKNIPLLQERLSRITFAVTKDDAGLDLPDKMYDLWEVEMTSLQADYYKQIAEELAIEFEDKLSGEVSSMTVDHILTSLLRLAQITSGYVVWNEERSESTGEVLRPRKLEQINEENPKIKAVIEMLTDPDNDPNSKTVIWAHWVEDIRAISEALDAAGIEHGTYYGKTSEAERQSHVDRFNGDPSFKVFVANAVTAGEGLNLVGYDYWNNPEPQLNTYTGHMIFFSVNWSSIQRSQAEDRAHRVGTRHPVRITDLVVPETIDEEIRKRVLGKQNMAMNVMELKDVLAKVL